MSQCPCGNASNYETCCQPIHQEHANAHTPEQLMRARYSAHTLGLVDFVINTYHSSCNAEQQRQAIADSVHSDWVALEVLNSSDGSHDDEGFVTFKAFFNDDGKQYCLEERSRFLRENGLWYYIDGEYPQTEDERLSQPIQSLKIGRNDPCICGSGKKFKKCCG
ncbi:YchJ family protein [Vibrio fluminensis]|uniref:YchJ family protein n=1 Tax=Vibrio fluminensis TaxID=2783614 RepID=UPI001886B3B3|nr:YchJ family protein [Vibrio fluminensis]